MFLQRLIFLIFLTILQTFSYQQYFPKNRTTCINMKQFYNSCSVFVTHGAGPYPILADEKHEEMYQSLKGISKRFPSPKAIIVFSAHWQQKQWTIIDYDTPELYYDYSGFPKESYDLNYPIKSTKQLRNQIKESLHNQGYNLKSNFKRGYDHGVFVPLMIMYPEAKIPVVQISILSSLDPAAHFKMGKALRNLKNNGYMILCSGASIHGGFNLKQLLPKANQQFDKQLNNICMNEPNQQKALQKCVNWKKIKYSVQLHPREQHLIPLFVALGVSQGKQKVSEQYFDEIMRLKLRNFIFM